MGRWSRYPLICAPYWPNFWTCSGKGTVITNGGLLGKVTKVVDDEQIEVEIAKDLRIRQMRQMVSEVRAKGEPVKDDGASG